MNVSVLTTMLCEETWNVTTNCQTHITYRKHDALFILPAPGGDALPEGTANAALKYLYKYPQSAFLPTALDYPESIPVVFEKCGTTLWARVELTGLLIIMHGCTTDCITERLRSLLTTLAVSYQRQIKSLNFQSQYDTSTVWELMREFKSGRIAEQIGIDAQLLNQIMAGAAHACPEQTKRLETSLRKLGKQLMQVSLR